MVGLDRSKFKVTIRSCDITRRYIIAQVSDNLVSAGSFWIMTSPYMLCYNDNFNSYCFNKDIPIEQPLSIFNQTSTYNFLASKVVDSKVFSTEVTTKSICMLFSMKANLLIESNPKRLLELLKQQSPNLVEPFRECLSLVPSGKHNLIQGILYKTLGKDLAESFKYSEISDKFKIACDNIKDFREDIENEAILFLKSEKRI